jgi:hypothetical protein
MAAKIGRVLSVVEDRREDVVLLVVGKTILISLCEIPKRRRYRYRIHVLQLPTAARTEARRLTLKSFIAVGLCHVEWPTKLPASCHQSNILEFAVAFG